MTSKDSNNGQATTLPVPAFTLSIDAVEDLALSGIKASHLAARPISPTELQATGAASISSISPDGYVIPYFDLQGKSVPYYRVKLLGTMTLPKYRAPKDTQNHIYFPPGLARLLAKKDTQYIIITEGEKKAACAVARGFPCIGLAGVDAWRNRQLLFPDGTELTKLTKRGLLKAKIPSGDSHGLVYQDSGTSAVGLVDVVDYAVQRDIEFIICYDTDSGGGIKSEVQRASAQLGYELRYRGIPIRSIRQLIFPPSTTGKKIGLDDFLMHEDGGTQKFAQLLRICRAKRIAFPRHPNPKTYISSRLQNARLSRKEIQDVALAILMELEARGRRLLNKATEDMYYFDEQTHTLMLVMMNNPRVMLHDTSFGSYLYREFNLSANDTRIIAWLAAQFNGEPGVAKTSTHKVLAKPNHMKDCIAYQLSDSHYVIVTPNPEEPFIIKVNGTHGILFEQSQVEPIDHKTFEILLQSQVEDSVKMHWQDVLREFNFRDGTSFGEGRFTATEDELFMLAAYLFYLSPWFLRWRGTQLPIELVIGEAGSGKSSLYQLRQTIITGAPRLSNMTNDIRDWYAGITSRGGLYVMDNVHFSGGVKDYRQRLSDELCRLTTEPEPHIELRKLYTTSQVVSLPVNTTFAITAIEQPFYNTDLIQRATIFEVEAISDSHDSRWAERHLQSRGGREGWLAHHLVVMHKFLKIAVHDKKWQKNYSATHRLANYEQALRIMAMVFDEPHDWIPNALRFQTDVKVSEGDWTVEALKEFVAWQYDTNGYEKFAVSNIVSWAEEHETFYKNAQVTNSWKLGKYMRSHAKKLKDSLGIFEDGSKANKAMFSINHEE